jgi:hypothetical protein
MGRHGKMFGLGIVQVHWRQQFLQQEDPKLVGFCLSTSSCQSGTLYKKKKRVNSLTVLRGFGDFFLANLFLEFWY